MVADVAESGVAEQEIRQFVERILRLKEEEDAIKADIKDIYTEARGRGFDKTALGALVIHVRKMAKNADAEREKSAIFDLYLEAYERSASHTYAPARAREARSKARTSEAMADHKELSAELADAGLISREAHAENVTIADAVAEKFGSGSAGQSNSSNGAPDVRSRGGDSPQKNERGIAKHGTQCPPTSGDSMGSTAEPMHEEGSGGLVGSGLLDRPRSVTAGRDRQPAPREPLRERGHIWNNLRDAYGWPEDKIQEWWLSGKELARPDLHPEAA